MNRPSVLALFLSPALLAQNSNIAPGSLATQSSFVGWGEQAQFAIDGNRNGNWFASSSTCTASVPGAWWQVALRGPTPRLVNEVVIYNRADCCPQRLSSFRLDVLNGASVVFTEDFLTTGGFVPAGASVRALMPGSGVLATVVRLTNVGLNAEGNHYLQFSEVEVIAHGSARETNFSPYGLVTMSSTDGARDGDRAIDGNTDGYSLNGSIARTQNAAGSWLRLDLERVRIDEIRLWPGTTGQTGCGNLRVEVLDANAVVWSQDLLPNGLLPLTGPTVVTPPAGTIGSAVRITTLGPVQGIERLEFAEIEVLQFTTDRASHLPFGAGCHGSAGVPVLTSAMRPTLGASFYTILHNVPSPQHVALLAYGVSNQQASVGPLPWSLAPLGAPGCTALNSIDMTQVGVPIGSGVFFFRFTLTIPNSPFFAGMQLFTQGYVLDPGANALQLTVSNSARMIVGT